jgi:hypothetical protein
MIEISVKVSNSDQSYTKRLLEYSDDIVMSRTNPKLFEIVQTAVGEFKGPVEKVIVRTVMEW